MKHRIVIGLFVACAALLPSMVLSMPITKALTVNVYQLCDDAGSNCAATGSPTDLYFSDATNKIWAQAGIGVDFNFVTKINSTLFSNIDDGVAGRTFFNLASTYGAGQSSTTVDVFLVKNLAGAYGEGWFGLGGMVLDMTAITSFNTPAGRMDTLAHELGHNLGLVPSSLGGDAGSHSLFVNHLMAGGDLPRLVPGTLNDIAPDGLGYDFLPQNQIDIARSSSLLRDVSPIPEPGIPAMFALGALTLFGLRFRRSRTSF